MAGPLEVEHLSPDPLVLDRMLGDFARGRADPTMRLREDGIWRAVNTPRGPATQQIDRPDPTGAPRRFRARCYGPGAEWAAERFADLMGAGDDRTAMERQLRDLMDGGRVRADRAGTQAQRLMIAAVAETNAALGRTWLVPRSHTVWDCALAAVLEQKVTGKEAKRSWRELAREFGEPAPGPVDLFTPPTARAVRGVPTWRWRRMGVDRPRSDAIMRLARSESALELLPERSFAQARAHLTSIPGIGEWTYAEIAQRALGDPDAVSIGDYHLAKVIVYCVTGLRDGTDEQLLHMLEPFVGQRYRAARLVGMTGAKRPRRGPRMSIPAHRYG